MTSGQFLLDSESKLQEALARVMQGRTSIIIAQRISTVRDADEILVLDGDAPVGTDFAEFVEDLTNSLNGVTAARSMFAKGQYDADANIFTASKVGIYLLEP